MSAPASTSDHPVESLAPNASTSPLDASRRQPSATASGAPELAGQPLGADGQQKLAVAKKLVIDNLRMIPDFPIQGIKFIDILPVFQNPSAFAGLLDVLVLLLVDRFGESIPDVIVGLEARGFLFGPSLALRLGRPFVPVRKKGKMPGDCITVEYTKEYGTDEFQVQTNAIKPGQQVLIVDDIIATGGTAAAAGKLVELSNANIMGYLFMIDIINLKGTTLLGDKPIITLIEHNEEE